MQLLLAYLKQSEWLFYFELFFQKGGVEINDVGGDVDKPLNTDGEKEDADVQLRNRMSNNNHK